MKKIITLFICFYVTTILFAQIPTNGLIANYPLGISQSTGNSTLGTHKDIAGNNYHLNFSNGFGFAPNRLNIANEAAAFNGVSSDIRRFDYSNNSAAFQTAGNFTICAWVRLGSPISNEYASIVQVGSNDIFLRFRFTATGDFIQGGFRTGASTFSVLSAPIIRSNFTGNWALIILRRTSVQLEILVNNVQIGTGNFTANNVVHSSTNRFFTVGNASEPNLCLVGRMQDVLYYNRSLTSNEVTQIFNTCEPPVNATLAPNLTVCEGSSTTLTVTGNNISWFNAATGGSAIDTGNTIITAVLSGNTTYYAQQNNCTNRLPITVTVLPLVSLSTPSVSIDTSIVYCEGSQLELKVNGAGNNYRWFNTLTGGTALATGRKFITPPFVNNAGQNEISTITYYVEAFNQCSNPAVSERRAVVLKVGSPNFTFSNNSYAGSAYACVGTSSTFSIETNASNIQWISNGNVVGTSKNFTTPVLSFDSIFSVNLSNASGCMTSILFPVKVYEKQNIPPTNLTSNVAVCPGDSITLKATTTPGVPLNWQTNAGFLAIGDSVRVAVSNDGLYYVRTGTSVGCYSAVTPVQLNMTPTPIGTINLTGTTISSTNLFDSYILYHNGVQVAQSNTTGTFTYNNASCGSYQAIFSNTVNSCPTEISMFMRRQSVGTGCDNIIITQPTGITFPATVQGRKGGGTYTAPIPLTGFSTTLSNLCTVVGGNNNTEIRIVGANGCTYIFSQNTNSITTSSTPTIKYANYVEGDLLTTCPIRSNTINITLNNPSNTTPNNSRSACLGKTTTLTASGNGTLNWYNQATGGSPVATGTSYTTPPVTASTIYYVEATAGNCKSDRIPVNITLNPKPFLAVDRTIDTTICEGETVFLYAQFNNPINPVWIPEVGPLNDVKPKTTTTYTISVNNTQGCTATNSITIVVTPTNATPINKTVCFGDSTIFKGIVIKETGVYRDTLTNVLGCDSIITLNFTVNPLPTPTITQNGTELSTQNFSAYQWKLNNNNIAGATSKTFTPSVTGEYSVEVTDNNSCKNTSDPFTVSSVGLLGSTTNQLNVKIFPNPANDYLVIDELPSHTKIQILTLEGKILYTKWNEQKSETIATKDWAPGIYLINLEVDNMKQLTKFLITH